MIHYYLLHTEHDFLMLIGFSPEQGREPRGGDVGTRLLEII